VIHGNWICISSRLRDIGPETYWGHDPRYVIDHVTIQFPICCFLLVIHWSPAPISKRLISAPNISGSRPWPFVGHVTSSSIWPFDTAYSIYYSTVTETHLQPFSRYRARKILGSRPWPFKVTWRHRSRDDSIPHMEFPIGAQLEPSPYLQAFSRYLASNVSVSRPWPFGVTWRHWACDHLIPI